MECNKNHSIAFSCIPCCIVIMEGDKKRDSNTTEEQKQILLNFMEENIEFGKGKFIESLDGKKRHNALWDVLAQSLNSTGGPVKDTSKWQRLWSDIKTRVKKKAVEIKNSRMATGGGPHSSKFLTDFELRILFFISPEAAFGVNDPDDLNVCLESDMPAAKRQRVESESPAMLTVTSPCTPTTITPSSSRMGSEERICTTPSKREKIVNRNYIKLLLEYQKEINMKIENLQSTLEQSGTRTNQLLERIAVALEKWSDS